MSLETVIIHFGYPALMIGLLLEGETFLVLGAFMAHRGYLNLSSVILIGLFVTFASDQFFFWMGRTQGNKFLERRPAWEPHVERAKKLLGKNTTLLFIGVRFMYGLRTALAFVIGMARFDPKKFALLNFLGSFIWAMAFGLAGHFIGQVMTWIFEDVKEHELMITLGIFIIGGCVWLYRRQAGKITRPQKEANYD